jgi:uncharacterized protein (TIGR03435 family)
VGGLRVIFLATAFYAATVQNVGSQEPAAFDVTSVKRLPPDSARGAKRGIVADPVMLTGNASVKQFLMYAYSIEDMLILGGADWLDSEIYAISARTETPSTPDQLKLMLRSLLGDRFRLKFHYQTREIAFYALVQRNNGANTDQAGPMSTRSSSTPETGQGHFAGEVHFSNMASLARRLSGASHRPVIDLTGLEGTNISIAMQNPLTAGGIKPPLDATAVREAYFENLKDAVERQLGLKVESRKGPWQFLVIDSVDRPNEN